MHLLNTPNLFLLKTRRENWSFLTGQNFDQIWHPRKCYKQGVLGAPISDQLNLGLQVFCSNNLAELSIQIGRVIQFVSILFIFLSGKSYSEVWKEIPGDWLEGLNTKRQVSTWIGSMHDQSRQKTPVYSNRRFSVPGSVVFFVSI